MVYLSLLQLQEFIQFVLKFPNVWFATGREVAEAWKNSPQSKTQEYIKIG